MRLLGFVVSSVLVVLLLSACASTGSSGRDGADARVGEASYYGDTYAGRTTASGEVFDPAAMTAAHPSLPFDTRVRVTRIDTGASVVVRINDRGPFKDGRIIDLSKGAARRLDMLTVGITDVRLDILDGPAADTAPPASKDRESRGW